MKFAPPPMPMVSPMSGNNHRLDAPQAPTADGPPMTAAHIFQAENVKVVGLHRE